jgi:lipocalin
LENKGNATPLNSTDPGKLEVKFDGIPGSSELWVVDTDYENYYVSYSCQTILGIKFDNLWIAARKNTMSGETFRVIPEKARVITGFDTSSLIITNHVGCSYPTNKT